MDPKAAISVLFFSFFIFILVLAIILLLVGVPGDTVEVICLSLEVIVFLTLLVLLIRAWLKKKK